MESIGCVVLGFLFFGQVQEPEGEDEYEVCDRDDGA